MHIHSFIIAVLSALFVQAAKHHFFVGSYGTPFIYSVEYDNVANTLQVTKIYTIRPENEWLTLSYDGRTLYSSGRSGFSSLSVANSSTLFQPSRTIPLVGRDCGSWNGVYALASKRPPFPLYGSSTCSNWLSVTPAGVVNNATELPHDAGAVMYGIAADPTYSYVYSTDSRNGKIWTHKTNDNGSLSVIGSTMAPSNVTSPKSLQIHPSGKYMYVVLEAWNAVALYTINQTTHLPVYTNGLYPLVPADAASGNYGSQSSSLSAKGSILWATAHARTPGQPGYITAFSLSETGLPTGRLWQVKTPTSGGRSLNVAACPWSEKLFAISDSESGSVSIYESEKTDASLIVRIDIKDSETPNGGCCSNVVWVD